MAENSHIRIFDRAQHARRHLLAALLEARVHAGDHHVHLREHFVVQVERAVGENVHLDAGEDANAALHRFVHFVESRCDLLERALFVEAVGHGQILRVVGDGDVFVAALQRRLGHLADRVAAVAGRGVHVHVAANVARAR